MVFGWLGSLPNLNGADAAWQILRHRPDQKILVVTNVESEQVVRDCLQAGVRGWVCKSDRADELMAAIEQMQPNKSSFSARVSKVILDGYLHQHRGTPIQALLGRLSLREREVVQRVSEGKSSKEVATLLGMSTKTAETHRSNIMIKIKLHSTVELVMYAVRNEIVHVQLPNADPPNLPPEIPRATAA